MPPLSLKAAGRQGETGRKASHKIRGKYTNIAQNERDCNFKSLNTDIVPMKTVIHEVGRVTFL